MPCATGVIANLFWKLVFCHGTLLLRRLYMLDVVRVQKDTSTWRQSLLPVKMPSSGHEARKGEIMARLVLIRHGESEGNVIRIFTKTPVTLALTELGRQQARDAAGVIRELAKP